jgi:hypothetical protein
MQDGIWVLFSKRGEMDGSKRAGQGNKGQVVLWERWVDVCFLYIVIQYQILHMSTFIQVIRGGVKASSLSVSVFPSLTELILREQQGKVQARRQERPRTRQ